MSAVAKRFRTDEEALAFLDGQDDYLQEQDRLIAQGADPAPLTPEDVAAMNRPVGPMPELAALPGEDPIMRADLYGNLPPELLEEEPPLPVADERFQAGQETGDEMLPPVQTQVARPAEATFRTDDDAAAFLDAPAEALAPEDKAATGPVKFETDKAAADFLETLPAAPGPAGSSQLAYDTTVRPENVEGPIPFGEKDRPYRTRSDGTLEFDPRRMRDGVTQALKDQVITGEQFAKLQPSIEAAQKVIENEAKLRARAKDNGALASALQGFGRGGAMTLGAIGGSKAGAAAGLLTGPYAPAASPALGLVGGVAGAVTMGMNYDLVYKELAKHYEEYDAVLAAAELNPGWNTAGELVSVAVGVPQAVRGAATALATTRAAEGAAGVARQVGTAAGLGAGSGVAGYSLDRTVRGEPITPGGLATAAAAGAAFAPFMITPGAAGTQEMASITAKVRAGQPISPMERRIYEAAAPAMRAAFAEMDAAGGRYTGGRYDASGKWMPGMEVTVPTSSVLGLAPAAGRATVRLPYEVPARLGAPAVAKAQGFAARPTLAAGAEGAGTTAPVRAPRPTEAPVNVLPPGPTIVTPTQAMLGVEEFLARQVGVRGIQTKGNFEAILELMDEHKQIVTDAIGRNEPVSIDALDSYEIRVPYYDRDEETGLATYSEEGFKAYEAYLKGQDAEAAENVRTGGIDIFEAIRDSGGLPSGKSDKVKQWAGELKRIREAQNPGNALGVKGTLNLFRKDAPDLDGLIKNLQGYGFQVTTPAELFDLIDQRFKTGKPIYAYGAEEPLEMRGRRRPPAPGAPRQGELLGESDVEFSLVGQTDRTSLTPAEQAAAAKAEADKAEAEKGQGDLFGAPRVEEGQDPELAAPDPQAYFDFSNVPASKQTAGSAAVQAAASASGQPYQAPAVSPAGGVVGAAGLEEARARQAAAYRGLLGGDARAVAQAIRDGVPLSRLMLGYISREPATFNITGAIIKSPRDLAMYNLAHRTPFFESMKIAVLDDRQQVIHSQVVSTGSLNESIAHPRDVTAVALAAQKANPKAKIIGFMIMHNHPSGDPTPSEADRAVTRRFSEAGNLLGVPLLDHVITNGEQYFSFSEAGLLLGVNSPIKLARSDAKPRLPVRPAPEGQIAPGQMAEFEAIPASEAANFRLSNEQKVKLVHETLQTADPNMIHVINVDTRYGILSVVRHPLGVRPADVLKASTPESTYAMFVSLPAMPPADARPLVRRIKEAADLLNIHLLDAAMIGEADTFKQRALLEEPEAAYGSARRGKPMTEAERRFVDMATRMGALTPGQTDAALAKFRESRVGSISSDPFTPPAQLRGAAGGPAQVPPGQPMGAGAASSPDWVLGPAETRDGRRLVKGIEGYKPGQRWGFRSIVDYVNKAVRMEMRRSKSQTSAVHPAHYKPANHMAYTRETQSQINFHEAGHGLEYLIRARVPAFFDTFADELIALTNRPGSMASDPPASASDKQKRQYQIGEGVAEWTRLLMTEPAAVANMRVTPALNAAAEQYYPGMAAALRDGARAVQRFQNRPVAERWAMFNADPSVAPTANEVIGRIIRGGQDVAAFLASGAPVSRLDRMIPRAIMANRDQVEMTYKQALAKMREVRATTTAPLMQAHNMILSIGAEASNAIAGTKPGKGLRVIGPDGKFKQFTRESWRDLRRKIPSKLLPLFDSAAWARESLTRWEAAKMEYPGMREGISPDDLRAIVANATRTLRNRGINFDVRFAEQSAFFGEILNIKDFGGLKKPGEVDRMTQRDTYWPLPRVMQEGRGRAGKARGDIMSGDYRAFGSGEAIRQTDEVAEERVRAAYEAYYWNRFLNMLADKMAVVAKDQSLPIEARSIAGASIVRLNMPMKVAATVSKEEVIPWVIEAIKDQVEKVMGIRPELKPEDINLSWNFRDVWRPTDPKDPLVVSSLRDGERVFYQLGDPAMFGMFANPQTASKFGKFLNWALGPMTQNWKRNITQGPVFAIRNLFRDTLSQAILNPDPIAWIPGGTHILGTINKFTKKYPQVFQEGLLLSRIEPGKSELVNKVQHGAVWQWLTEGWYVSQSKDPVVKLLATYLQPSNLLFLWWKVGDVLNLITGGRTLSQFFETAGREGAAISVLRRGGTDEEALMKYWTAAGQFNEHAGVADARIMMNIPGFFNPMIQGLRNAGQRLSDPDPAVAGTAWARMLIMMPLLFGAAAGARYLLMSKEEKDRERNRPVDDRMNFMEIGGFSVPFPYGAEGVMGSMVYNSVMDDLLDRPRVEADKTVWMMLKRIFDPGSPLSVFGPQLSTLGEASFNWSVYRQKHIVSPWMAGLPASQQFYSTTPKFYQELGEWFNYSPAKLQYIMQQAISRQADETIRYMESLDRGRPIQEPADVPFVGRLFIREPLGFSSQPLRDAEVVETRLRDLDMRLQAKGWYGLRDANYPQDQLGATEMRNLYMQLQYLEGLRFGLRRAGDISALAKTYALAENYAEERNTRRMLTTFVQSLLLGNKDMVERIDMATELLKQIPERTPQEKAAEYLERRF